MLINTLSVTCVLETLGHIYWDLDKKLYLSPTDKQKSTNEARQEAADVLNKEILMKLFADLK